MNKQNLIKFINIFSGCILLLLGLIFSVPVIEPLTKDGEIGSSLIRIAMWVVSLTLIGIGISNIIWNSRRNIIAKLSAVATVSFLAFLVFDYTLYLLSPLLPLELVWHMTPQAQIRYQRINAATTDYIYEDQIRYMRPFVDQWGTADEYGYKNPAYYLENKEKLDVLLIGDSFTWGTSTQTVAGFMREVEPERTIYSIGMNGSNPSQWYAHFKDYIERVNGPVPEVIVLNLYVGNDLTDIDLNRNIQQYQTEDVAELYIAHSAMAFGWPYTKNGFKTPKVLELPLIAYNAFIWADWDDSDNPTLKNVSYSLNEPWIIRSEPSLEDFTPERLSEIGTAISKIQKAAPDSTILVSYIPTVTGIYGALFEQLPNGDDNIKQQKANASFLSEFVGQRGATLISVAPALQAAAYEKPLWSQDDHFSYDGYKVYSIALEEEISLYYEN